MSKIDELRRQIESYREVLSLVKGRYQSSDDQFAEQLIYRLLSESNQKLKVMEQRAVKLHRSLDLDAMGALSFSKRIGS